MIIRTRRRNESLLGRLVNAFHPKHVSGYPFVQTQEQFETEIARETERSNRRSDAREFALVTLDFSDRQAGDRKVAQLAKDFTRRLRISDTVGWYNLRLAVLLPETGQYGAVAIANDLSKIASQHGIKSETSISIYPWDDCLTRVAGDLRDEIRFAQSRQHEKDLDRHDGGPGGGFGDSGNAGNQREDHSHSIGGPHANLEQINHREDGRDGTDGKTTLSSAGYSPTGGGGVAVAPRMAKLKTLQGGTGNKIMFLRDRTPVWKRAVDIFGSGIGILLLSPVFVGAAIAIKVSAPGPIFFRQMREGKDGKPFGILKFRTMVVDAEEKQDQLREHSEQDGPAFKLKDDPRITTVGKYLRKSCIDELPQLFNVLIGQMSLVGPRPLPVSESEQCNAWQRKRLSVLPGCTCIWQARGGRDIKFSNWMRMDLEYIENRSFFYDLRLILETVCLAVLHKGSV